MIKSQNETSVYVIVWIIIFLLSNSSLPNTGIIAMLSIKTLSRTTTL
jgi:hypothetical protein